MNESPDSGGSSRDPVGAAWCHAVLVGMLDPLVIIDGEGVIRETSRSVERTFGWSRDELVGRNVKVLMPEPHSSAHDGYLRRYLETGESTVLGRIREFPVVRKDGERILCALAIERCDVPGDAEPYFVGCFREITEQKRVEEELTQRERALDAIFEQESAFLGIVQVDGRIERINGTCLAATGLSPDQVSELFLWQLPFWDHDEGLRARMREAVERATGGLPTRCDVEIRTADERMLQADFLMKPITDGSGDTRFLLFEVHDVTNLRRAQQAEMQMLQSLAEIGETAADLVHEIKNPLTGIHLALRTLAGKLGEDESAILEDLAGRLQRLEKRMRRTLQFARPERPRLEQVEAEAVVEEALEAVRPRLDGVEVELRRSLPEGNFEFRADSSLLQSALTNLLYNAIEAGDGRGRIQLSARPGRNGEVRITVEDDGPGIPKGERRAVFRPFVSGKRQGTGLGLALVRKTAQAHGGSVELDESDLGGARFTLVLPRDGRKTHDAGDQSDALEAVSG